MRITDVLHKEGTRKPKKVIAKKLGFSQSAISNHIYGKWTGRKTCCMKRQRNNGDRYSPDIIVKKSWFKNLWELYKKWIKAGVNASSIITHRDLQERNYCSNCQMATVALRGQIYCNFRKYQHIEKKNVAQCYVPLKGVQAMRGK